jgi:putative membrane protein
MQLAASIAIAFVAFLHVVFMILEMFFWTKPLGKRTFHLSETLATEAAPLAMNQGLYNGFLAAGLVWGLLPGPCAVPVQIFFLSCVVVAGVFGAITAQRSILFVQGIPGMVALGLVLLAR